MIDSGRLFGETNPTFARAAVPASQLRVSVDEAGLMRANAAEVTDALNPIACEVPPLIPMNPLRRSTRR